MRNVVERDEIRSLENKSSPMEIIEREIQN